MSNVKAAQDVSYLENIGIALVTAAFNALTANAGVQAIVQQMRTEGRTQLTDAEWATADAAQVQADALLAASQPPTGAAVAGKT